MAAKGQTIIQVMEKFAPKHLAMEGDKIGLQLGTLQKEINKVLIALDVTDAVVDEAIRLGCELIIAHHAIIYRPLSSIQTDTPAGRLYEKCIRNDIAVYISHTNLDVAEGGVNDMMAEAIGLNGPFAALEEVHTDKLFKLVVFVPEDHHERVLNGLFSAGAGWIGNYSHCSFNIPGTGTFVPREGTNPYLGEQGKLERASEVRVETIVPDSVRKAVIQALLKAHPYEEVAYDLYPVDLKGRSFGIGRVGKLEQAESLADFTDRVKKALGVNAVRVVGSLQKPVRKIAVLGGSGSKYVRHALFAGADVLVTGDIDYHTAHDAAAAGLAIVDPGHNVEKIMKEGVAKVLRRQLAERKIEAEVIASAIDTEIFQFL
ncbi:Nif3-like dinuclear metal center hexameric protein [Paenibacillus turpanensis]|uniref:Nif3-like dinuclear metal center hexameric protein n=1 Tax=Paenibacillus turpanensis TaxID=2689078 RepID=UPI00140C2DD2|nr:Nif3-like dinuclear metal center hexameric protein [Paenibacillus turpanensis]